MATEAQILANRQNAQHSTGPRTDEGKLASSRNAIRHGLTSAETIIYGEDNDEFDAIAAMLRKELHPASAMQELAVNRIIHLQWKLRRIPRLEKEAVEFIHDQDEQAEEEEEDFAAMQRDLCASGQGRKSSLAALQMHEQRLERSLRATMKELRELRKDAEANDEVGTMIDEVETGSSDAIVADEGTVTRGIEDPLMNAEDDELDSTKRTQFASNDPSGNELPADIATKTDSDPAPTDDTNGESWRSAAQQGASSCELGKRTQLVASDSSGSGELTVSDARVA